MGIKQAIDKAKVRAKEEATSNNYGDSMMFVVSEPDQRRLIVLTEWEYDLSLGLGDILECDCRASVWSDGELVEVERYP